MGLTYCNACGSVEGRTRLATAEELNKAFGLDIKTDDEVDDVLENYVCRECDTVGEIQGIPEHDDYDMER